VREISAKRATTVTFVVRSAYAAIRPKLDGTLQKCHAIARRLQLANGETRAEIARSYNVEPYDRREA
jgi:hypothetical protein